MRNALFVFFIFCLMASCKEKPESIKVKRSSITSSVYASGIVKSRNQFQVYAKANGILQEVFVKEGDFVKKGQVLFTLSNETPKLNADNAMLASQHAAYSENQDKLNELQLNIDVAKKKMKSDSLLLQRQRNLWNDQIGTKYELEQRELSYSNSKMVYESALLRYRDTKKQLEFLSNQSRKNLSISQAMLSDYSIVAPQDGRIYNIMKEKGEMISSQTPVAFMGDANQFYLMLQVDENDIIQVEPGMTVYLTMESYKNAVFLAKVDRINPYMNEKSRTFEVEAIFTQQPQVLYPNLNCEANIQIFQKSNVLVIPRNYLIEDSLVLREDEKKQKVETGLRDYQRVEIIKGLNEGDEIFSPAK
ncbi:MAG: efflux RND transporter periplasmic adaptor subunit [Chitinophagaceae bacterium]|nr:efflux RND transporter periplasmic adaptor subunit [Chitinophagaceae bacterium]